MHKTSDLQAIVEKRDNIRFLVLFKLLKTELQKELKAINLKVPDSSLNQVCTDATKELLSKHVNVTKEDIKEAIKRLADKLK